MGFGGRMRQRDKAGKEGVLREREGKNHESVDEAKRRGSNNTRRLRREKPGI